MVGQIALGREMFAANLTNMRHLGGIVRMAGFDVEREGGQVVELGLAEIAREGPLLLRDVR